MVDAAQWRDRAILERNHRRQPVEARGDPGGVSFGEGARLAQRCASRYRQHRVARGGPHAQGEASSAGQAPQPHDDGFAGVGQYELGRVRSGRGLFAQEPNHGVMLTQNISLPRHRSGCAAKKL
jgi:hypothetical protein